MSIDGTWNLTFDTPIGTQETTLVAKAAGGALTGTQTGRDGSQARFTTAWSMATR